MKSVNKWLYFLCFSVVILFACSGGGGSVEDLLEKPTPTSGEVTPSITLGKSSLSFGASSSSETVTITSNVDWDFECSESWVTISKGSASQLNVSVSANYSSSARNASISLKQQGKSTTLATISVSQSGAAASNDISASKTSLSFTADGGSENITVTSNFTWETITKPSWITLSPSAGSNGSTSVVVTADKSSSTSERTGTIKLGKGSTSVSIAVNQNAASNTSVSGNVFTVNGVSFKMIRVEGGTFTMGATAEQGDDAYSDEKPAHSVTLSSYSIGETEVTQELWEAVMGSNPSAHKGKKHPVNDVSWDDCQEFIRKLNALFPENNFRLPTEAEWEYAARGGKKSQGYKYAGSNMIDNVAWYGVNSADKGKSSPYYGPQDVGGMAPNELGLYDMSGNVCEWCYDWYGDYSSGSQTNPTGPSSGSTRVVRGGGWNWDAYHCRVSTRIDYTPDRRDYFKGFRLAL